MASNDTILQQTIIEELGLQDLSQDQKEEALSKLGEVILKRIYLETFERLEKPDQDALIDLTEKNPDGVEAFLTEKIPNYENFVKTVVENFKQELKEDMGILANPTSK